MIYLVNVLCCIFILEAIKKKNRTMNFDELMNVNDLKIWPVFHQNKRCATLLFFSHTFCDIISAPSFYDLSFEMSKKIILCKSTFIMLVISYLRNLFQENIWLFNDLAFNFKGSQLMIITKVIM